MQYPSQHEETPMNEEPMVEATDVVCRGCLLEFRNDPGAYLDASRTPSM